jgi:hypothetical protein
MNGIFAISSTLGARPNFVGGHGKKNSTTTIDECQMKARTNGNCNTCSMLLGKLFVVAKFGHYEISETSRRLPHPAILFNFFEKV